MHRGMRAKNIIVVLSLVSEYLLLRFSFPSSSLFFFWQAMTCRNHGQRFLGGAYKVFMGALHKLLVVGHP